MLKGSLGKLGRQCWHFLANNRVTRFFDSIADAFQALEELECEERALGGSVMEHPDPKAF